MKTNTIRSVCLFPVLLSVLPTLLWSADAPSAVEVRLSHSPGSEGGLQLSWSGGRPAYQLQKRAGLQAPWIDVGDPTLQTTLEVPLTEAQAFYRVVADYTARYEVVFDASWSRETHPQDWTSAAHWSGLVGAVHNDQASLFEEKQTASEGIRLMAERGRQDPLLEEAALAMRAGAVDFQLRGNGLAVSPGSVRLLFPQPMRRDYPFVTLCSMVAPSPDWFVGVSGLSLLKDGEWQSMVTVPLYPYDAGTDSGVSFASGDLVTAPRGVITRLTEFPIGVDGVVVPFGTFTFRRLD